MQRLHVGTLAANRVVTGADPRGLRVFTAGHSFHVYVGRLLADLAGVVGIAGHLHLGTQFLGGSRTLEHWELPEHADQARRALRSGRVDVLTLSPTFHPDPGINHFVRMARDHNFAARVTVQASWVPFDGVLGATFGAGGRDMRTGADLQALHAPYFAGLDAEAAALNAAYGEPVLAVVPVGQALIALRERISRGQAPGLRSQEELFVDALGHPAAPVQLLATYAHYAVIYRQSPVGLPAPAGMRVGAGLNRLLQELAWAAAVAHPLSGLAADKPDNASERLAS